MNVDARNRRVMLERAAVAAFLLAMVAATSGGGNDTGNSSVASRVGCVACGGGSAAAGKAALKGGCALKACGSGAGKVALGTASKAAVTKVGVAAGAAAVGERAAVKTAGTAFLAGADDATLVGLRGHPELAARFGELDVLPRTRGARELYLESHPDLARDVGRYLEQQEPSTFVKALVEHPPEATIIPGVGKDVAQEQAAVYLKEDAQQTAERFKNRFGELVRSGPKELRRKVQALQKEMPEGTQVSLAGDGMYVRLVVSKGAYSYSANVDLASVAATGGAIALTHEMFRPNGAFAGHPGRTTP